MPRQKKTTDIVQTSAAPMNWNDPEQQLMIRESYGKTLSDPEWKLFLGMGMATGLNPFLKEIWAVKYGTNAASIFIARDGYRKSAQSHAEYEYHYAMAVYTNDTFELTDGEPKHSFDLKERGKIVGAYCVVKRKSSARAVVNWVDFSEYVQTFGVWKTKPATMIAKVAEAQGLRASFQELFAGTLDESESWEEPKAAKEEKPATSPKNEKSNVVDAEVVDTEKPKDGITTGTLQKISVGWKAYTAAFGITKEESKAAGQSKINALYGKTDIAALTEEEGQKFASILEDETKGAAPKEELKNEEAEKPKAPEAKTPEDDIPPGKIRTDQTKKMYAVWREFTEAAGITDSDESIERRRDLIMEMFNLSSSTKLNEHQADDLIARIQEMTREAKL